MNLVEDNAILFAGATGRVGGATLATLVAERALVAVVSRDRERAQAAIDELPGAARDRTLAIGADLNDPASAASAVDAGVKAFGRIDALVNLAGSGGGRIPLADSKLADLRFALAAFTETAYNL